ncbi:hypothetical protein ABZ896_36175 [Streptomyces sp. NPDC047072]|uniref:hypothetical protein n=1 Tax=Streptomyces sp. NPDC047072 TaxID=3154809 RepID=UPI0034117E25
MNSVVFGNLGVSLTDRHGARLTRLRLRAPGTGPVRLPYGTGAPPPPYAIGREDQLALVRRAVHERGAVEFTGPCGTGKTTLLKNAGGTYLRVGGTELEDLLQELTRRFYDYPGADGVRLTTEQCAQALGHVGEVVALDDVPYGPQQLDYLRRVLPGCVLVIGAPAPALGASGTSYPLPGLAEPDAVALLLRELGRRHLPDAETAAVRRLVAAVGGQPLHLRQAAALARLDGRSLPELAALAESDPGTLDQVSISAVAPEARRALAVLTLLGGALLPAAVLTQMADLAYVAGTFESLTERGLAEQAEDRFGLPVCKSESYRQILYRYIGLASTLRSLTAWLASRDPAGEEARGAVDAALSLLGLAAERRQWQAVVQLVTVVERILFVQGHWQAWQNTLAQGITAAQAAGDRAAEAYFTHQQGVQHFLHDRLEHADRLLRRALDLRTRLGDLAGAAVTRANLELLAPPPTPPAPPSSGPSHPRRLVMAAVAGVVAVLVVGSVIVQALGGGSGEAGPSSPPVSVSDSTGSGSGTTGTAGETTTGTTGETTTGTTGETTTGETTTGQTTTGGTPVTLAGPEITPVSHDFGGVDITPGSTTQEFAFTITNPNDQAIAVGSATVPADSGFSSVASDCKPRLEARAFCTETVEFWPTRVGSATSRLTVESGGKAYTAGLSGTGYVNVTVTLVGASDRRVTIGGVPSVLPDGVSCDGSAKTWNCAFDVATEGLNLTATISDRSFYFVNWSGVCTNPDLETSCSPALDQDGEVTATFAVHRIG